MSHGSSDDEGKIAKDGFSNEDLEDFRVGGPYRLLRATMIRIRCIRRN